MLSPYRGDRVSDHFGPDGAPLESRTYGADQTGSKTYRFNSLGFRGPEFDPEARIKIFVSGSSYALGTGLNLEETWPELFRQMYARKMGLEPDDVNLMNFAVGGSSNDYIARMALTQCAAVKPDLLIVQFVFQNRTEGFLNGTPFLIGTWNWLSWWRRAWLRIQNPLGSPRVHSVQAARRYYAHYTDELGFVSSLKNLLLVQYFCQVHGIRCLITWTDYWRLQEPRWRDSPVMAPLINQIDDNSFHRFAIEDPDIRVDLAADRYHPGPQSQQLFASRLLEVCKP